MAAVMATGCEPGGAFQEGAEGKGDEQGLEGRSS